MKNYLLVILTCLISLRPTFSQLPCPEITSSTISPGSGTYCPGDEFTLTWDGINLEYAIICGFCWYMYEEGFEEYGWYLGCPYQVNFGPCVSPEILYVMANPDDDLVGSTDDCHDEFFVVYIGGRNPFSCAGGDYGIFIEDLQICFNYQLTGNYCPGGSTQQQFTYGNASTFNCGTAIGPADFIPENSILVIQTSPYNNIPFDLGEICNLGLPVYIIALNTSANCTGGFIPNSTGECNSCALLFWPDWCHEGQTFFPVFLNYELPSNPTNGWGISNVSGGGVYGNVVPDINISTLFSGTEVIPLPLTWEIPSDFCQEHNPGTYYIVGGLDYAWSLTCPNSPITSQIFEITISCLQISAGLDILVCEGETVTLEGENGGNTGTFEWTSSGDGTFGDATSIETDYEPGINDIQNGSVVLTLTLNSANSSCESVSDDLILTILESIQAEAGVDQTICNNEIAQLSGVFSGGGNNPNVEWTSDGDGIFGNANSQYTSYSPGANDIATGAAIITLSISDPSNVCEANSSEMILTILQLQTDAGSDQTICFEDLAFLNGNTIGGTDIIWTSSGDGIFGDVHLLQTTYAPGPGDVNTGVTTLTLTNVDASGICDPVSSTFQLTINSIVVTLDLPNSICENAAPLNLSTLQSGIYGNWSGPGVINNTFDPAGQNGIVTLTFTPDVGQCALPTSQNVIVNALVVPVITDIPLSLCEVSPPITLLSLQNSFTGNWSGPGVTNNTFDPAGQNGVFTLTFTPDAGQCATNADHQIIVHAPVIPLITGLPSILCENESPVALTSTQDDITGNWSGPGVTLNTFNPNGLNGTIILTFTPDAGQCAISNTTSLSVELDITPLISGLPASICENVPALNLSTIQDGVNGSWSGDGVSNNIFHPAGLNGSVELTFYPYTGQCAEQVQWEITIISTEIPVITGLPSSVCQTDLAISLPTLQNGIDGNWSGPGVLNNIFNPDGQEGNITLIFIPENSQCFAPVNTSITVTPTVIPIVTGVPSSLCQSDPVIFMPESQSGIHGNWSGPGISANVFSPSGLHGSNYLTFTPVPGQCAEGTTTEIQVNTSASFINLQANCDSALQTYTVTFDIIGGDPASYMINGMPVGGTTYISPPFSSDTKDYSFVLTDANGCSPVDIEGSHDCSCVTFAGTMIFDAAPYQVCEGANFMAAFNDDVKLDQDDLSGLLLHDNSGTQLGTIYAWSNNGNFSFPSGVVLGQVYFISAIAGSADGSGNINLLDPCLSVSQGIPVIFYRPSVTLSQGITICQKECIVYSFELSGVPPFEINYKVSANGTLTDHVLHTEDVNPFITICPEEYGIANGVLDIVPITLKDANCLVALSSFPGSQSAIRPATEFFISDLLCPGQSIVVNGIVYDQTNPSGIQMLQNSEGCDSTIHINLSFYENTTHNIHQTLCLGGSLIVNGTEYNEKNPEGIEIIPDGSVHGCDSVISIQLVFDAIVTADFSTTLCAGESMVINGTTYDESHPAGTESFPGGSALGCDSLLNINLSFYPPVISNINEVLCHDELIIVNGTIYDQSHSSGTETMKNASVHGCDSIIHVDISFHPEAVGYFTDTLNEGESMVINGTLYDQLNTGGIEVIAAGSKTGCDSIVVVKLHFRDALIAVIETVAPVCHGELNGEIVVKEITGGLPPYMISLNGVHQITVTTLPFTLSGLSSGVYHLGITDDALVTLGDDVVIPEPPELKVNAGKDIILEEDEDARLIAESSFDIATWLWSPGEFLSCVNCPDPLIKNPQYDVVYTITATDKNGCQASDEVMMEVRYEDKIYVPTAFSPNGDAINDTWRIYSNGENTRLVSLQIVDRYGGMIFRLDDKLLNDSDAGWDGKCKDRELLSGVYVYLAVVERGDGEVIKLKGEITLLR